ncbi:carotenoid oxygenase family protein [Afipia sp. DC4300-2b1]|uniref:carotenoid oxygenase family protein n=1 Tax=Afipia sp. DC4300-2b1 TaxID=2804672 RepID=UPI003CEE8324
MSNPFLLGGFAPVEQESDCQQLKVIGEIPAQLRGTFVRNGPNPIDPSQDDCWTLDL